MNAREPIDDITDAVDGATGRGKRSNASRSLVDFLRAIRFPRKAKASSEEAQQHFAGLSSTRQAKPQDEDDCIRSAN